MRTAGALMPALPDHAFAVGDDATDHWVGAGGIGSTLGQAQCVGHVQVVEDGERDAHATMVPPLA